MDIDDRVDRLFASEDVKEKHTVRNFILLCVVMSSLGAVVVIPAVLYRKDRVFDVQEVLEAPLDKNKTSGFVWSEDSGMWRYWNIVGNVFGYTSGKDLNDSYFQWFYNDTFFINLSSSNNGNTWEDANHCLEKYYSWDSVNDAMKITWVINTTGENKPYYYRAIGGLNKAVVNYTNLSNVTQAIFTVPVGNESVNLYFNWSDLIPLVENGTITFDIYNTTNNGSEFFGFEIYTVDKLNANTVFTIDPIFGNQDTTGTESYIGGTGGGKQRSRGFSSNASLSPSSNGILDNITFRIRNTDGSAQDVEYAIYYAGNKSFITNTTQLSIPASEASYSWRTISVVGTHNIYSDRHYLLLANSEAGAEEVYTRYATVSGHCMWRDDFSYPGAWPSTTSSSGNNSGYVIRCYASYTEVGAEEAWITGFSDNFSYGNLSSNRVAFSDNFSYSNTSSQVTAFSDNFSYSSTAINRMAFSDNFSYSSTASQVTAFSDNFSYSNSDEIFQTGFTDNFSYSSSVVDRMAFSDNFSYSHTASQITAFTDQFSYSNGTVIRTAFTDQFSYSNSSVEVVTVYPGVYFDIENDTARFGVFHVMNFSIIVINDTWIMFNTTDFNVSNPNFLNVSLSFIDSTPLVASNDSVLLSFYANSTSGSVTFDIGGFDVNETYYLQRDDVNISNTNSDASGIVSFTDTINNSRFYSIVKGSMSVPGLNWITGFSDNYSYGNLSSNRVAFSDNFSYSHTADQVTAFSDNYSYSSTVSYIVSFSDNYSYSNSDGIYNTSFTDNFSYSNSDEIFQTGFTDNFSYSSDVVFNTVMTDNFSYSNSTPPLFTITLEYPSNGSSIFDLQPMLYFNLTHPNGNVMNYSLYIDNTTLVYTGNNVSNGTQFNAAQLFYSANTTYTSYYWVVRANDGTEWVNESYNFQSILQGGGGTTGYGAALAIATGAILLVVVALIMGISKRRKSY